MPKPPPLSPTDGRGRPRVKRRLVRRRLTVVFTLLRPVFQAYLRLWYGYRAERFRGEDRKHPCLILSNHDGPLDPFMLAVSFRRPIYFVASDHIFRLGFVSRLIRWLVAPIPIVKSIVDTRTIRDILTTVREGGTVGLFPSGNRSFAGREAPIPAATAKLVRHLRIPVVFYRFDRGYLATPRWARHARRGRVTGRVVRVLRPEEAVALSTEELHRLMVETLHDDPYAGHEPLIRFRGRRLAEHLERVLFVCPSCFGFATLRSRGDRVDCGCGFAARSLADGRLVSAGIETRADGTRLPAFSDVDALDRFQREHLASVLGDPARREAWRETPLFLDDGLRLVRVERARHARNGRTGTLRLYAGRLSFGDGEDTLTFPVGQLGDVIVHGPQTLQFHDRRDDAVYEVRAPRPWAAYAYMLTIDLLRTPAMPRE